STVSNALFLLKWMILAYLLEALMIRFIPTELVVSVLGGEGLRPVLLGALIGGPAYLNGYAAVPVVAGMLEQGMSQGAAMAFVLAGSVTCIPAAVAVWALVRARIFLAYLTFAIIGSVAGGVLWAAVA
ncbi:MAG: permease, partial [Albidovulum sp.]|nr:permease [Albidovulum sp.]